MSLLLRPTGQACSPPHLGGSTDAAAGAALPWLLAVVWGRAEGPLAIMLVPATSWLLAAPRLDSSRQASCALGASSPVLQYRCFSLPPWVLPETASVLLLCACVCLPACPPARPCSLQCTLVSFHVCRTSLPMQGAGCRGA